MERRIIFDNSRIAFRKEVRLTRCKYDRLNFYQIY
jgi:hypothetical protein